ncbi:MAG: DNA-directed RNA polymerase [Candidatus Methanomethylophilaceae archaeon]|nr:DNA-directed RNA polymerase [Candidatus Methanomethylophilaceae archaeon]
MYTEITDVERLVCIPPAELGEDIDSIVEKLTWETYGGRFGADKSFTVLVKNVRPVGPGRIVHGNGGVHQAVKFDQVVFRPENDEIVEGNVVEIVKFGAFVRFGPLDGLLHVSQVMDDRVDIDENNQRLVGKESGRYLAVGDVVRARVVSIDLNEKNPQESKIGLTMRQIGLGKLQWLDEDNKKKSKGETDERCEEPARMQELQDAGRLRAAQGREG